MRGSTLWSQESDFFRALIRANFFRYFVHKSRQCTMRGREKSPVDDAEYNKYINRVKIRNYINGLLFY